MVGLNPKEFSELTPQISLKIESAVHDNHSYRFMIKNQFSVIALNLWLNGIEIGSTSKHAAILKHAVILQSLCLSDFRNTIQRKRLKLMFL